jgi:hypothetical protein
MAGIEDLSPADQQAHKLGVMLLRKNPDIARRAKRLAREADPTLVVPELELEDQIAKGQEKNQEKIAELEQRLINQDVQQRRKAFREDCEKQGLDPTEVEKIVVDEKCSTATAIKVALLQRQTAEPTAGDVLHGGNAPHTPIDMRPDKDWRKLEGGALRRRSADIASEMVNDFAKARRSGAR